MHSLAVTLTSLGVLVSMAAGKPFIVQVSCPAACKCTDDVIDCEMRGLTEWPRLKPSKLITGINLYGNDIHDIPEGALDGFPNLEWIFLGANNIRQLKGNTFHKNSRLMGLWLDDNDIQSLPSDLFTNQKDLNMLNLANNGLKRLPMDTFDNLNNLELLDISGNDLSTMSSQTFANLGSLLSLNLDGNVVTCDIMYDLMATVPDVHFTPPCLNEPM